MTCVTPSDIKPRAAVQLQVAAAASKNVLEKEEWVPPPPDKVPETDLDYQ
jgi:hypothetical protein